MLFDEIAEPVSALPEEGFRFRDQSELLGLANTNTQLPGILIQTFNVVWLGTLHVLLISESNCM